MIVYNLACDQEHEFEGWFSSQEDFQGQTSSGLLSCPTCGSKNITKRLSAPYVNTASPKQGETQIQKKETALAGVDLQNLHNKFIDYVVKNTEDVGVKFPEEARKIYYGESDNRSIRGEASGEAMKELQEEGIEVYALPTGTVTPDKLN